MSLLRHFDAPVHAVLVGASGGIGQALLHALLADPAVARVDALCRTRPAAAEAWSRRHPGRLVWHAVELGDEASIAAVAAQLADRRPTLVLVASGQLHQGERMPEKSWRALTAEHFQQQMQINALAPALLAKHLIPLMPRDRHAVFAALSARVGSIGDNRLGGWYSYRASKAALNMLLRCLAIEAKRRWPRLVVAGLHPGTVATPLSQPFQQRVADDRLFTPDFAAAALLRVVDELTPEQSGQVLAWNGEEIPP